VLAKSSLLATLSRPKAHRLNDNVHLAMHLSEHTQATTGCGGWQGEHSCQRDAAKKSTSIWRAKLTHAPALLTQPATDDSPLSSMRSHRIAAVCCDAPQQLNMPSLCLHRVE